MYAHKWWLDLTRNEKLLIPRLETLQLNQGGNSLEEENAMMTYSALQYNPVDTAIQTREHIN